MNVNENTFEDTSIGYKRNENPILNSNDKLIQLHEEKIVLYESGL